MLYQCTFIYGDKCTIVVQDINIGEVVHISGQEAYGNAWLFLFICCEPKITLKLMSVNLKLSNIFRDIINSN